MKNMKHVAAVDADVAAETCRTGIIGYAHSQHADECHASLSLLLLLMLFRAIGSVVGTHAMYGSTTPSLSM